MDSFGLVAQPQGEFFMQKIFQMKNYKKSH
jgi:hypothetical protein